MLLTLAGSARPDQPAGLLGGECVRQPELQFCIRPNSPSQMAAFFEARGFPEPAIRELSRDCFITVGIENLSNTIVWLEPSRWEFRTSDKTLERITPQGWAQRWQKLDLPQGNRATFSWTLLPESRDLRPSEPVGGNIVLPRIDGPFSLEAIFATGENRDGEPIRVRYKAVRCARDDG